MSYQVLARKYRPQRFSDVVGQDHVTQTLSNAIRQNRIAHAYLFVGPRGTGKTTLARIFAKCLNCVDGPKVDFSDRDPRCQEIAEGRSLDVLEIDGASNRGIEEIRELRETVKYAPSSSRFKIYIIDEVHMLTKEAFNALLKTLEEPPAHVKFMFATTEPEKVIATILSRCQRFDLRRIPTALIVKHLAHIARLESVQIDDAALHAIARGAEGCMRDAESTLDQLISFCGERIVEAEVLSMFGLAARAQIIGLARALLAGETENALRQLHELAKHGKDLARLLSELLNHFRNLLLFRVSNGDPDLLEVSETEAVIVAEQASSVAPEVLMRVMEVLTETEARLRDAASKRIVVEVALLKAMQARNAVPIDRLLRSLQQLRDSDCTPQASVLTPANAPVEQRQSRLDDPKPRVPPPVAPAAQSNSAAASPPAEELANLARIWKHVIEAVGRVSPFARSYLLEAHPVSMSNNVLTIGFDPEFADHLGLVDNSKNRTLIQTKLQELGCGEVLVKFVVSNPPANWVAPAVSPNDSGLAAGPKITPTSSTPEAPPAKTGDSPTTKEDFKNDPLIKQALEIFKGTIVEVRA
ncbi:MAG: DNA polymerase III subunit gamma/tau [Verrucomicrobia bacterium]|nr:DNA polymerase III subunit gamma/tau [Verrucomicrobiota bacterium]